MKKQKTKAPFDDDDNQKMFERTGCVRGRDRLEQFLYIAMRDGDISPGRIEDILQNHVSGRVSLYSNGFLAKYAKDVVARLRPVKGGRRR